MYVIKRKTIIMFAAIILGFIGLVTTIAVYTAMPSSAPLGLTVVIDAGHGGRDGGVQGRTTGIHEAEINLAIARNLRSFLEGKGYRVIMTRSTPDGLYGLATDNRKLQDMAARRRIIQDAEPDLVISIHQNSFPSPTVRGPQVFFAPRSEEGERKATIMQNVLNANLDADRIPRPGDFFILQCNEFPALLIETGFLSNPEEERLLISAAHQEKVAYSLFVGIHTILFPTTLA
ncbi:MAG: N-acetylmuramoyl-L-alanine amidase [Firmicutes bacterium]|nr:N-acetylmuramoyl-L-alanine amidase [Bacillota bacterium]